MRFRQRAGNLREVRVRGVFRNVARGRRTITGRQTGYYGKWKEWKHVANWLKGERQVDSRLLAEDEIAELGVRTGKRGGDLRLGGGVGSGCRTEA